MAASPLLPRTVAAATAGVYEYEAVRTTAGPTSLEIQVAVPEGFNFQPAFVAAIGAVVTDGRVTGVVPGFSELYNGRPDPLVSASGVTVSGCDVGVCHSDGTAVSVDIFTSQDSGGPGAMNRLYLVVEGPHPKVTLQSDGWTLQPTTFAYRYIDGSSSADVSVFAEQYGVEAFRSATLSGGVYGSMAQAAPPCSSGAPVVGGATTAQVGVGQVTLSGGKSSPSSSCPSQTSTYIADWAAGATQWTLSGLVVGDATLQEVRLFVVDLAAPEAQSGSAPTPGSTPASTPAPTAASAGGDVVSAAASAQGTPDAITGLPMTSSTSGSAAGAVVGGVLLPLAAFRFLRRRP